MASVNMDKRITHVNAVSPKEEEWVPCNGEARPESVCQTSEPFQLPKQQTDTICSAKNVVNHDDASMVSKTIINPTSPDEKTLKMTKLDSNQVEIRSDKENCPVFESSTESAGSPERDRNLMKALQEPVSLSKTSSLLREVQQLGEEEDRELGLQRKMPDTESDTARNEDVGEAGAGDVAEPITYHILENSTLVKFEPDSEHQNPATNVPKTEEDGFDGHTITLVEDENNAGTFKIAQIGDDNTLRVIDNDRIVVFQDESAVNAVCKTDDRIVEPAESQEEESPSSCISRSMNALNSDNVSIPDGCSVTDTANNNTVSLHEKSGQTRHRRVRESESPQPYVNEQDGSERVPVVQTYADTSIMRPLHSESGSHSGQHHSKSGTTTFPASSASGQGSSQGKTWHHPAEREPSSTLQPQYASETVYQQLSGLSGVASGTSHHQTYPEYGLSSSSSSATSHGSYGELGTAYTGYTPQMTPWTAAGHVTNHPDGVLAYNVAEGDQKIVGAGFGHPHAATYTSIPPSYVPSAAGYVGYSGDHGRAWRTVPSAKSTESAELHHGGRDATLYHQQHQPQHPHHGTYPAHTPTVVRPFPTFPPGWEGPSSYPTQRHVRYMNANRGRGSSRIHKTRLQTALQNAPMPVNISSMATRSSAPVAVNVPAVGRPRKRSASQGNAATANKGSSSTSFTGSKEPPRKRSREQQAVSISTLSTLSSNVHTLKPGHIIAWYIDYLIHENEDRTQISRAFTLPVNLFHTDDFYFLDSLRKTIRFPSSKFLAWMQCHLPSLNAHAIDFREGRPKESGAQGSAATSWNSDWAWQNKSKRDIIHDVFFYFQHRKAGNTEPHQYINVGTRSKAQLVA